jgi:hypothetical protein
VFSLQPLGFGPLDLHRFPLLSLPQVGEITMPFGQRFAVYHNSYSVVDKRQMISEAECFTRESGPVPLRSTLHRIGSGGCDSVLSET